VIKSLSILAEADFPVDLIVWPRHLPTVLRMLEQVPRLHCVVDHLAKPPIRERKLEPWKHLIAEVAAHLNVHCKLSGMVTEAGHKNWTSADLHPYIEHVVKCFGLERVMFGSDWPVCRLAATYDQVINAVPKPLHTPAVFGDNAARFYRLKGK
jgi:L-fuconolactonase